jgi:L-lactate dehydrogenase complex protein LldE
LSAEAPAAARPKVALLVTCLVDLFRPGVGFATVELLERAGFEVEVPEQTCCGQPAWNGGDRDGTRAVALQVLDAFEGYAWVVAPSGSCTGMLKQYPEVFAAEPALRARAEALAARCVELTSFLVDQCGLRLPALPGAGGVSVTYHDSCSGLRELGVQAQPRALLAQAGYAVREMQDPEACCGFGGLFCVKYPDIADSIVGRKCADAGATGATLLVGGDLGCLLHMAGRLSRDGAPVACRHIAELLAPQPGLPPLARPAQQKAR